MKKILSVLLILLLIGALAACTETAAPPAPPVETEEPESPDEAPESAEFPERPVPGVTFANVRAQYLEEFDLSRFDVYHEFVEPGKENDPRIVITTEAPISGFSFVELGEEESEWGLFEWATMLYSLDTLTSEAPFVVTWMPLCFTAHRGIVFFDEETQQERFFEIIASGYDGSLQLVELEWRMLRSPRTAVTGLLEYPDHPWTSISVAIAAGWSEELEALIWDERALDHEDAQTVHLILSTMDAMEVLTPFHQEGQHADPMFKILIHTDDETLETIFSVEAGNRFFRFTDTFGSHGDPGYVVGTSDALLDFLTAYF